MKLNPSWPLAACGIAIWLASGPSSSTADPPVQPPPKQPHESTPEEKSFWSFQPPADPSIPAVHRTDWPKSPLDHFVLAALEEKGLFPAPAADKRTLIRRATFDLIGLPPAPAEIEAFLADDSPDAFARVVDRLLASPHYGERWGRHWLDVARYADSNGMDENMAYGNAWRYRDYVVAAFNRNLPYDQFVREQLAGDLMAGVRGQGSGVRGQESGVRRQESGVRGQESGVSNDRASSLTPDSCPLTPGSTPALDRLTATGFLTLGPKMLAEDDPVKMEMDIIDEQVDTVGRTFMGLTLGCARCHEHKFDPIPTEDYYSLAGIFKSTQTMDNFKVVARWHERPLGTKDEIERQQAQQQQIAAKKSEIANKTNAANETMLREARRHVAGYLLAGTELLRHDALQRDLKSVMADAAAANAPGIVVIEAEDFARGNVKKEFTGYGEKIGVIYNAGSLPNVAEYDVTMAEASAFQLELRYAAAESRPVKLSVNGQLVKSLAAGKTTGSWYPDTQAWAPEAIVSLAAGKNTIRLERDQPFPHFDKLALVPRKSDAGSAVGVPKAPEVLAAEHGLNVEFLHQWAKYLDSTKSDPNSPLFAWHAFQSLSTSGQPNVIYLDLKSAAARALATRYQELCDQADHAWTELRSNEKGKDAKELPDPGQESLRKLLHDPKGPFAVPAKPEPHYPAETVAELDRLRGELATQEKSFTPLPEAMAVEEGKPQNLRVHLRGSHLTLGDEVPRRFLRVIPARPDSQTPIDDQRSGRLELADWLTQPNHPLTARVMVNRSWRWHFGEGIVRSTDNFGRLGDRPDNQPLLDWLARRFVESGWSIKAMHRVIMLSSTYQMSTAQNEQAARVDPENRLHWRMNRRRLEAEAIRDAILAVSGQLDPTMGGSLFEGNNRAYVPGYPNGIYGKYDFPRRSIYLPVIRSGLYDVFQAFDFADPSTPNGERTSTTVAPQALFMMNSKLVLEQTKHMAASLLARTDLDDTARLRLAYERAYGRPPSDKDSARAVGFLQRYESTPESQNLEIPERRLRAWQALCRVLLASNEFIFVE